MPFQPSMKASHHDRSDLVEWSLFLKAESSSISRRTKVRPGGITVAACCRWPSSDSSSLFLQAFLVLHSLTSDCIHLSFSSGSLTTSALVSISKPRNTMTVAGPTNSAGATGMPSLLHESSISSRFLPHVTDLGGDGGGGGGGGGGHSDVVI